MIANPPTVPYSSIIMAKIKSEYGCGKKLRSVLLPGPLPNNPPVANAIFEWSDLVGFIRSFVSSGCLNVFNPSGFACTLLLGRSKEDDKHIIRTTPPSTYDCDLFYTYPAYNQQQNTYTK
jgi:hypothetical protein